MSELRALLIGIRKHIEEQLGNADLQLDSVEVPSELHSLLPFAEQFGIGDDGARDEAIEMLPPELVRGMAQELRGHQQALDDWIDRGDFTLEKSAFVALMQSILYVGYGPGDKDPVPTDRMEELRVTLRSLIGSPADGGD